MQQVADTAISIHAPLQGATRSSTTHLTRNRPNFNPRTLTGCDLEPQEILAAVRTFQSTHPYRVRLRSCKRVRLPHEFQSTHPYRVRHALIEWVKSELDKFQSTHPYRVRPSTCSASCGYFRFQSTHPYRVRRFVQQTYYSVCSISIHAPLQGATSMPDGRYQTALQFQSTHPYRVRQAIQAAQQLQQEFQSTHPYRVRLSTSRQR